MAYRLPNFNLLVRIWQGGSLPSGSGPTLVDVPAQLYVFSKGIFGQFPVSTFNTAPSIIFRFPIGAYNPAVGDIIDSVAPPGDYYIVGWSQIFHPGFPNTYLGVLVAQCDSSGTNPRP